MIISNCPERISRIDELAKNLWWVWHEDARKVFRALSYPLWRQSKHNPVKQLKEISSEALQIASKDPAFLSLYDSAIAAFDAEFANSDVVLRTNEHIKLPDSLAYFSMEFAIHSSLPIYAGGLGILAGDICKEASDMGVTLVAIGFMYPQGYFQQRVSSDGWQEERYKQLDFQEVPISRVLSKTGNAVIAKVKLDHTEIAIGVWQVEVGHTKVYLLDTNLEENPVIYRQLSARLYVADPDLRLQQEIILGIGGVRVLRALGINPSIWHANEGHTAFMMLERVREKIAAGVSFEETIKQVRDTTVFTTHTPVLAGHDSFPLDQVKRFLGSYLQSIELPPEMFLKLGQLDKTGNQNFNMTVFAFRLAQHCCAVSKIHGKVTRKMWHGLWKEVPEENVPIASITNGVHIPSWIAPELAELFTIYLGNNWMKEQNRAISWKGVSDIPDERFWSVHQLLKRKLIGAMRECARSRFIEDHILPGQMLAMGTLFDPEVLTIGFTRRFTEYKRPELVFRDIERLKRIANNTFCPVQIVFAGKSHPADYASKQLLQRVYKRAMDAEFQGHIAFIEDYNMHLARYLVQGVDVWLNTPRRLQEACGTSGMKAALNGVLNLSIPDGWWDEAFNGKNGWSIGSNQVASKPEDEDITDSESIYQLLENEIVPLYYSRDRGGVPNNWISRAKETIQSIVPVFCARRMMNEYVEQMYKPAFQSRDSR